MKGLAEMPYKSLQITQSKSVVRVAFNRPKVLNALNEEMIAETTDIFQILSSCARRKWKSIFRWR